MRFFLFVTLSQKRNTFQLINNHNFVFIQYASQCILNQQSIAMKKRCFIYVMIFMTVFVSCKDQTDLLPIEGSIYIKLIDFGSLYEFKANKEKIDIFKQEIENFDESKSSPTEIDLHNYYKALIKENLLESPYAFIKVDDGDIRRVFFSIEDYRGLEVLLLNLHRDEEQIDISLKARKINNEIFLADQVISIQKVKGKTDWKK